MDVYGKYIGYAAAMLGVSNALGLMTLFDLAQHIKDPMLYFSLTLFVYLMFIRRRETIVKEASEVDGVKDPINAGYLVPIRVYVPNFIRSGINEFVYRFKNQK